MVCKNVQIFWKFKSCESLEKNGPNDATPGATHRTADFFVTSILRHFGPSGAVATPTTTSAYHSPTGMILHPKPVAPRFNSGMP